MLVKPEFQKFSAFPQVDLAEYMGNRGFFAFSSGTRLGVSGQNLTGQLGDYFGTPEGVLVTSVEDGTPARTAGLKAGDVITRINGEAVRNLTDLRRIVGNASGETRITIFRDRKEQTITMKLEDERVVTTRRRIVR
jgi:serine protease Do